MDDANKERLQLATAYVRNAMATLQAVLDANRQLAGLPGHEASAADRIFEGELEMGALERELAALTARDVATATRIAEQRRAERDGA
jgi:hypothetical protein